MEPNSAKVFRTMNAPSLRVLFAATLVVAALAQNVLAASKTGIERSSNSLGSEGPAFTAVRFRWGGGWGRQRDRARDRPRASRSGDGADLSASPPCRLWLSRPIPLSGIWLS